LQSGRRAFRATLPKSFAAMPAIPAGSQVEVTGVSWTQPLGEAAAGAGQTFDVLLRTPADVIVRQRPPWWTWKHTTAALGAFVFVLGLALFWIRLLRQQVAQRTSELQTAMTKLEHETEISATLTERNRLAGELHDGLEQGLSAIMMQLDGLESKLSTNPAEAVRYLKLARNMIRFSRTEVRHSLWDWKSPALTNKNLGAALSDIAGRMSAGNQAKVTVHISGLRFPLPHATEHHLLRIGQEALTNALKYSDAADIYLDLNYSENSVQLSVRDTGRGFVPEMVLNGTGGHLGLQNLRSRARKMGGRLTVTSAPGRGTTVEVTVPVNGANTRPQPNGHSTPNEN
jgi:signal transduction histidine kinase